VRAARIPLLAMRASMNRGSHESTKRERGPEKRCWEMPLEQGSGPTAVVCGERLQGTCQAFGSFLGYDCSATRGSSRNLETYRWAIRSVPEGLSPRGFRVCAVECELDHSYKIQISRLIAESSFEESS